MSCLEYGRVWSLAAPLLVLACTRSNPGFGADEDGVATEAGATSAPSSMTASVADEGREGDGEGEGNDDDGSTTISPIGDDSTDHGDGDPTGAGTMDPKDYCGNGVVEPEHGEECEGQDWLMCLENQGVIVCEDCKWNDEMCSTCGNQIVEDGEECDGDEPTSCQAQGLGGPGWVGCSEMCEWEVLESECCILDEHACTGQITDCCSDDHDCIATDDGVYCQPSE